MAKQCRWRIKDSRGIGEWNCQADEEHTTGHVLPSVEHCKTVGEWFMPPPSHNGVA